MKFSSKLNNYLIFATIVGFLAIAGFFYFTTAKEIEKGLRQRAEDSAFHIMDKLERFMFERLQDVKIIASSVPFKEDFIDLKVITRRLIDYRNDSRLYTSISFYDTTGKKLADTSGLFIGKAQNDRLFFREAIEKGVSAGTEINISDSEGVVVTYFSCIVKGKNNTVIGVVAARVPLYKLQEVVASSASFESEKKPFMLDFIDANGKILYSSRGNVQALKDRHFHAFAVEKGYLDYKGNGRAIVIWVPEDYILGPVNALRTKMLFVLILAIIFAIFIAKVLSRQILKPLRKFAEIALRLGKGDLGARIDYKEKDELGELAGMFNNMAADLKQSHWVLTNYSKKLEDEVRARTRALTESTRRLQDVQEVTLSILEDTNEAKLELEASNAQLTLAQKELAKSAEILERKVEDRTRALAVLYEVSNAVSYTLDYQTLFKLIMESLFKVVDYDICASILFDKFITNITLKPAYSEVAGFLDEVKNSIIYEASALTGENIQGRKLSVFLIPATTDIKQDSEERFDKLRSFFYVPFIVRGKAMGLMSVSGCRENAFSSEDVRLIRTIANQASGAIERLQEAVSIERSKMESMVEGMAEGVIMLDERGILSFLNPQAKRMLGIAKNKPVEDKEFQLKMEALGLHPAFKEVQAKGGIVTKEITFPSFTGGQVLHCEVAAVKNLEGASIGAVAILRDITKEKNIDRMKSEFISTVSHELRTPLSITREGICLVLDGAAGKINEEQVKLLDTAKINIDRLARIIGSLLDISKIEAGRMELKRKLVNINELLSQVTSDFKLKAKEKNLELIVSAPKIEVNIYIDKGKVVQVLTNLVGNAIKFTEKGFVEISLRDRGDEVVCSVFDTGMGISANDLPKVFDKFEQFSRIPGAGEMGTGLGLAIAKGIVVAHGGKIWVESTEGAGAKFIFTLPKYVDWVLFMECVTFGMGRALDRKSRASIIAVFIDNFKELISEFGEDKLKLIIKDLRELLIKTLRRKGDAIVSNIEEILVFLEDCDKDNVLKVSQRLGQVMKDYFTENNLTGRVNLRFGLATYPDDATTAEDLVKEVRKA